MWILPEGPFELLFCCSCTGHINGKKELFEINVAILVRIKGSEDMIAKLLSIAELSPTRDHCPGFVNQTAAVAHTLANYTGTM